MQRKQYLVSKFIAPKVTQAIADVRWESMTAQQVYNLYRALYSFKPITTKWQQYVVKLIDIRPDDKRSIDSHLSAGTFQYVKSEKSIRVCCADGRFVLVNRIGIEGKRVMSAMDFRNGFMKDAKVDACFCN